jgi:hypothetical protein
VRLSNPVALKDFMGYFKTESAHAINRLLGRRQRTVWCRGYDSPLLLTPEDVVEKIVYTYGNPSKDSLVDCIDVYPGLSSWQAFRGGSCELDAPILCRPDFSELPRHNFHDHDYRRLAQQLSQDKPSLPFRIFPNAWMKSFGISEPQEVSLWNERIISALKQQEAQQRHERIKEGRSVIGCSRLVNQRIGRPYSPRRWGRRMLCICQDIPFRARFVEWIKQLVEQGREALREWRRGNFVRYPLGLYPPSVPRIAELCVGLDW